MVQYIPKNYVRVTLVSNNLGVDDTKERKEPWIGVRLSHQGELDDEITRRVIQMYNENGKKLPGEMYLNIDDIMPIPQDDLLTNNYTRLPRTKILEMVAVMMYYHRYFIGTINGDNPSMDAIINIASTIGDSYMVYKVGKDARSNVRTATARYIQILSDSLRDNPSNLSTEILDISKDIKDILSKNPREKGNSRYAECTDVTQLFRGLRNLIMDERDNPTKHCDLIARMGKIEIDGIKLETKCARVPKYESIKRLSNRLHELIKAGR